MEYRYIIQCPLWQRDKRLDLRLRAFHEVPLLAALGEGINIPLSPICWRCAFVSTVKEPVFFIPLVVNLLFRWMTQKHTKKIIFGPRLRTSKGISVEADGWGDFGFKAQIMESTTNNSSGIAKVAFCKFLGMLCWISWEPLQPGKIVIL